MTLVIKLVMQDIHCVSDLNAGPDHNVVWEGLEDIEEIFTKVSEVIAKWLNLISGTGNDDNKGMALFLAEGNTERKFHTHYQVKYLVFIHEEDQHIMLSLFWQKAFSPC